MRKPPVADTIQVGGLSPYVVRVPDDQINAGVGKLFFYEEEGFFSFCESVAAPHVLQNFIIQ